MTLILWLAAVALVVIGIVFLFRDREILGIVLIILGFLVGPGGYSIFRIPGTRRLYWTASHVPRTRRRS